jgi:flagellar biosynthetic protein FliR
MDIFHFSPAAFTSFLLTLMRVSLVVFLLPFYGGDSIPATVKGAVCLVLTMALWPHLSFDGALFPGSPLGIILLIVSEALLGLVLGLAVHFIFAGIQTGGELMGFQMGFTMVTLADPMTRNQVGVTSHMLNMVSLVIFLFLDGHLHLLRALADSFALVPPGGLVISPPLARDMLELSGGMFTLALKIAAPVIAALFMVELALALMARAAPQMNLLTLGFPVKIAVGFFFLSMLFTVLAGKMEDIIIDLGPMFIHLMRLGT